MYIHSFPTSIFPPQFLLSFFFCVNWWCIDFNLYPLLPINYTKASGKLHCMHKIVRIGSISPWMCWFWYQQYGTLSLLGFCLFIMHFNYVKTSFEPQFGNTWNNTFVTKLYTDMCIFQCSEWIHYRQTLVMNIQ